MGTGPSAPAVVLPYRHRLDAAVASTLAHAIPIPPLIQIIAAYAMTVPLTTSLVCGSGRSSTSDDVGAAAGLSQPTGCIILPQHPDLLIFTDFGSNRVRSVKIHRATNCTANDSAVGAGAEFGRVWSLIGQPRHVHYPLHGPRGICFDAVNERFYVTQYNACCIIAVRCDALDSVCELAGVAHVSGHADGPMEGAQFTAPGAIVCSKPNPNLNPKAAAHAHSVVVYVADNGQVRAIYLVPGLVRTLRNSESTAAASLAFDTSIESDLLYISTNQYGELVVLDTSTDKFSRLKFPNCPHRFTTLVGVAPNVLLSLNAVGDLLSINTSPDALRVNVLAGVTEPNCWGGMALAPDGGDDSGAGVDRLYICCGMSHRIRCVEGSIVHSARSA